uniref:Uncharacterized protein n=1 Tax=Otus sunia TaxID=257818 RepID=A0A8C8E5L5_9STRI
MQRQSLASHQHAPALCAGNGVRRQGLGEGDQGLKRPREMRVKRSLKGLGRCWETREALVPVPGPGSCSAAFQISCFQLHPKGN